MPRDRETRRQRAAALVRKAASPDAILDALDIMVVLAATNSQSVALRGASKLSPVCAAWRDLVDRFRASLTSIDLDQRTLAAGADATVFLLVRKWCPTLTSLDLHCARYSDAALCHVAEGCPQLKALKLMNCSAGLPGLLAVARSCTALESLDLCLSANIDGAQNIPQGEWDDRCADMDTAVITFASCCPHLRSLRLENAQLRNLTVRFVNTALPRLQSLDLHGCYKVDDSAFSQTRWPELRSLTLEFSGSASGLLSAETLVSLRNLETLELQCDSDATDTVLAQLVAKLPKLTCLSLDDCPAGDKTAAALARSCKQLKNLRVVTTEISDVGIEHVASLRSLEFLSLTAADPGDLSARALEAIARHRPPALRELILNNFECSDPPLRQTIARCPSLNYVEANGDIYESEVLTARTPRSAASRSSSFYLHV